MDDSDSTVHRLPAMLKGPYKRKPKAPRRPAQDKMQRANGWQK